MDTKQLVLGLIIMCLVTYLTRVVTMVLGRKQIKNIYVKSFLFYLPYCVLSVMIFPSIFYSTNHLASAIVGTLVALILAFFKKGLALVAITSILAVFLIEIIVF